MNSTCKDAYSIFCEHNKDTNNEKITFVLNVLNIYKNKTVISDAELSFLSHYIHFSIGKDNMTPYQMNILTCALSKLTIVDRPSSHDLLNFIFYSITRNFT
uniref:Uncharacterized protein n=1 Tax=viral metagenome TaxID=1070528 RepID=A0A6C0B3D8_9ZZZZ